MRILFGHVRTRLPGYRRLTLGPGSDDDDGETMLSVDEVFPDRRRR
jgi:hypothetical protein